MTKRAGVRQLQDALLNALQVDLASVGFTPNVKEQTFTRASGDFAWVIHVAFVRHKADIDATVDLGLRIAPVERLFDSKELVSVGSATVGAELGNLVDRRPRRWTIESELDASTVSQEIRREIEKFGLDWFRRFSQLETLYETLAANDMQSRLLMPLPVKRCLLVVALALLLKGREDARTQSLECHGYLLTRGEPMLATFDSDAAALVQD
jgi:hypothetical protein